MTDPTSMTAQPAETGKMVLRTTNTSPFGRKTRIAADVLDLADRIDIVAADPRAADDSLRAQNPLGKMPCLLLADGTALYDSRVILEFFDAQAGGNRLLPATGRARFEALTRATLADGVMDAALLIVYETRFRAAGSESREWLGHQQGKIARALAAFAAAPPDPEATDIVSIGLACALGYLDWRQPYDWRTAQGGLVDWFARFADAEPAFARTAA